MTLRFSDRQRDRLLAVVVAVFAASTIGAARGIEDSLLSDAVGAGGVPQGVGIAMLVAAVALFIKTFLGRTTEKSAATPAKAEPENEDSGGLWRTAGLVLILIGYGLLLPVLGYPLTVSLLVGASGWLAGAAFKLPLGLCALLTGPLLWGLFDRLLQVRMPLGSLWGA